MKNDVVPVEIRGILPANSGCAIFVGNEEKLFVIQVERVVITELKNSTYFARLILKQQNELATKLVEIDARPSDCLALATAQKRPLFVATSLFNQVEDMSKWLEEINENGGEPE